MDTQGELSKEIPTRAARIRDSHHIRPAARSIVSGILAAVLAGDALVEAKTPPEPPAPDAAVVNAFDLKTDIDWQLVTDVGVLVAYAEPELHTYDLLDGGRALSSVQLPGAKERGSVVHLGSTSVLLVLEAKPGLLSGKPAAAPERDLWTGQVIPPPQGSYAVDMFTGAVLWEGAELPKPKAVFLFEASRAVVLRSGPKSERFTAVDLDSGRILWEKDFDAQFARVNGGRLEVLGEDSGLLDVRTGERSWAFVLPTKRRHRIVTLPGSGKIVIWKGDEFEGYSVPPPDTSSSSIPATVQPTKLWDLQVHGAMKEKCQQFGWCFVQMLPQDRLLVASTREYEVLDAENGKSTWKRKRGFGKQVPISPSGKLAAEILKKDLVVFDLDTGKDVLRAKAPKPREGWQSVNDVVWLSDDDLFIVFKDAKYRPRAIARYGISSRSILWNNLFPEPADYSLTAKQKGAIVGKVFLGVAVLAAAVVVAVPASTLVPTAQQMAMQDLLSNLAGSVLAAPVSTIDPRIDTLRGEAPGTEGLAWRRYRDRQQRLSGLNRTEILLVTGVDEAYRVAAVDLESGQSRVLARYPGNKVHAIDLDPAYGLAVSMENNKRTLRILSWTGSEASPVRDASLLLERTR